MRVAVFDGRNNATPHSIFMNTVAGVYMDSLDPKPRSFRHRRFMLELGLPGYDGKPKYLERYLAKMNARGPGSVFDFIKSRLDKDK